LRSLITTHKELALSLTELERKLTLHDKQIIGILDAIRQLMAPLVKPKRKIGFDLKEEQARYTGKGIRK
jgi:hypothetical protein